jgi:hypothetical protein
MRRPLGWLALALVALAACASASPRADVAQESSYGGMVAAQGIQSAGGAGSPFDEALSEVDALEELDGEHLRAPAPVAAATPAPPPGRLRAAKQLAAKPDPDPDAPAREPTDGERGPLLVYEAWLQLAVFEVDDKQRALIEIAERHGGFLAREEAMEVVVRVPAANFKAALAEMEGVGNLLDRRMKTHDVTEQFRDIQTRLDSARKVRQRLLALLDSAVNVEESLAIELEIERLLAEIERMEGKLRFMADRIAFSTITATFRPLAEETPADDVKLPFGWLEGLGLRNLMELDR